MIELQLLGTSAMVPTPLRGLPAQMVFFSNRSGQQRFLVDCGEGTMRQILAAKLGYRRLDKFLLTHSHLDHIYGLGTLVSTLARSELVPKIEIFGGKRTLERVGKLLWDVIFRGEKPKTEVVLVQVQPGQVRTVEGLEVSAFPVTHRGDDCFGYLFREKRGPRFSSEKATTLGVPEGKERRALIAGDAVTLPCGRTIEPHQVMDPPSKGAGLAIVGDAGTVEDLVEPVRGVDLLVIESTYLQHDAEMARNKGHLTALEAAILAREAGVGRLVLTHISPRNNNEGLEAEEARAVFPNTVVGNDFDLFTIKR